MVWKHILLASFFAIAAANPFSSFGGLSDIEMKELLARMGSNLVDYEDMPPRRMRHPLINDIPQEFMPEISGPPLYDELELSPSLRDREYLTHSSLVGNSQKQHYKEPAHDEPKTNTQSNKPAEVKADGVLPAYCNPPNPCPIGYTAKDGCLEEFENTAGFSEEYQAMQECMCDTEHMFHCPDSSRDSELSAIARSIQNEGALDETIDKIMSELNLNHVASKKFHAKKSNPYLVGDKLPVHAKKGNGWSKVN